MMPFALLILMFKLILHLLLTMKKLDHNKILANLFKNQLEKKESLMEKELELIKKQTMPQEKLHKLFKKNSMIQESIASIEESAKHR